MADSKQKQLERARQLVKMDVKARKDDGYDDMFQRMIDLYSLKHFEGVSKQDQIAVAITFSTVNVILPAVAINHPKTTVMAQRPEDDDRAAIAEAVLDWAGKSWDVADEFRLAVKDFIIVGHGWVKVGYRFAEEAVERDPDDIDADFAQRVMELEGAAAADPEGAIGMPTDDEIMSDIPTTTQVVIEDRPFVERVSPFDVFVNPDAVSFGSVRRLTQRVVRPLAEAKADKRYNTRARNTLKGDLESRWAAERNKDKRGPRSGDEDIDAMVTIWEMYDLRANTLCVFADQGEGFLVEPQKIPYKVGHPFVFLPNYTVPDQFYPIGDLEALEPLQHELNRSRGQLMEARKQFARKHLYNPAALGPTARDALESPTDSMVPVNEGYTDDLSKVIVPVPTNNIPTDLYGYGDMMKSDMIEVSGTYEYQRGAQAEIRRTATEAAMIQDQVNARSADKLAVVERGVADVGRKMLGVMRQYITGEQYARIMGRGGLPIWVPFTQEDLDADMDLAVEGGSTQPKNEAYRQNQAMQMLQALGPLLGTALDPLKVAEWTLRQFGVKNPQEFILQQPPMGMGMPPGAPVGPGGPPMPPDAGTEPPPEAFGEAPEGGELEGVPPELIAQLAGQVGYDAPPGAM